VLHLLVVTVVLSTNPLASMNSQNAITQVAFTLGCNKQNVMCFSMTGTVQPGTEARKVTIELVGVNAITDIHPLGTRTVIVPANHTNQPQPLPTGLGGCFPALKTPFLKYHLEIIRVTDMSDSPADLSLDVRFLPSPVVYTATNQPRTHVLILGGGFPFPPDVALCGSQPPATAPPARTASGSALAPTAGLDMRLPVVGLALALAGAVLFVIDAARRRQPDRR
jgi:hypothetical protein